MYKYGMPYEVKFLHTLIKWIDDNNYRIVGAIAGKKLTPEFKANLTLVFGVCSMGMSISSIGLMKLMPAVIFALVLGTGIGLALNLGKWIN
jgi:uncharacterized membrane protein YqgA involved in biofilm formation